VVSWQEVCLALIAALPGLIAAIFAGLNRRSLKTPSGQPIGAVAERAHDLSAVSVHQGTAILKANGHPDVPDAPPVPEAG